MSPLLLPSPVTDRLATPLAGLAVLGMLWGCGDKDESDMSGPWAGTCTVETAEGESANSFTLQIDTAGAGELEGSGSISFSGEVWSGELSGTLVEGQADLLLEAQVSGSTLDVVLSGPVVAQAWTGTCELSEFTGTFDAVVGG